MTRAATLGLTAALTLTTTIAGAQAATKGALSDTRGLSLGTSFTGASVATTESGASTTESGAGFQVEGMLGINNKFALGLDYARANIDAVDGLGQYTLSHIGGIGRLFFRDESKRARPYVEGAILRREIAVNLTDGFDAATVKAHSIGGGLGGGVQIFAKPTFAFDISGQYGFGSFSDWTVNGLSAPAEDISATSFTLRLGARLYLR
jgi:hypothetical protein